MNEQHSPSVPAIPHTIDLTTRPWTLQGWRPFYWELRQALETGDQFVPEFGPFPAVVPGSAHTALRQAGAIPDWDRGRASLACEWVEHRHWEFSVELAAGELPPDVPVVLHAEGLDYAGWILVDGETVADFRGALVRHRFDLTAHLRDGRAHRLSILFDVPPEEQGQIGRTSLSKHFKPRYNFSWDWCVRLVPTGIWDRLYLNCQPSPVEVVNVIAGVSADLQEGQVEVRCRHDAPDPVPVELLLRAPDGAILLRQTADLASGEQTIHATLPQPRLWWPNGAGEQPLYEIVIRELAQGQELFKCRIGFKNVRWLACEDAPADARPLLCEVNGRAIFLQGVNWTPAQLDYPATTDADYHRLIELYREMGCNVLRVWGGGFLEKEIFYRLCDEAGLLVWQEFPLSSSGIDSDAPRDPAAIAELEAIATDYVRRRAHHACLLLWCGGNELQTAPEKRGASTRPLDENHPALAALARVVAREHPGIRFIPTSPSGPIFYAHRAEMGKGVHHHVHGPWDRLTTEADWLDYWSHDDSLLRAETGVAGMAGVDLLRRYVGDDEVWPPGFDNLWMRHSSAWWVQWELFEEEVSSLAEDRQLARFVELSQERQARFLSLAASACKRRFPQCAGFIVWMGHDAFPCPANTSIIDFDRELKPAYHALREVFLSDVNTLKATETVG